MHLRCSLFLLLFLAACASSTPPPLGNSDASVPRTDAGFEAPPLDAGGLTNAGADAAATYTRDYEGVCPQGKIAVWHFFDFQTHTPGDSSLVFRARSATTQAGLDAAKSVELASVTGPDITAWTGVDVDAKLATIGQKSQRFLRLSITFASAGDGTPPVLVAFRQQYDCVLGQ